MCCECLCIGISLGFTTANFSLWQVEQSETSGTRLDSGNMAKGIVSVIYNFDINFFYLVQIFKPLSSRISLNPLVLGKTACLCANRPFSRQTSLQKFAYLTIYVWISVLISQPKSPLSQVSTACSQQCLQSPLPAVTTARPLSAVITTCSHHSLQSPLPRVTTACCHQCLQPPLPAVTTDWSHHCLKSPQPSPTTCTHYCRCKHETILEENIPTVNGDPSKMQSLIILSLICTSLICVSVVVFISLNTTSLIVPSWMIDCCLSIKALKHFVYIMLKCWYTCVLGWRSLKSKY